MVHVIGPENNNTQRPTAERVEVVRKMISPYDLTSADNPGEIISHSFLRGNNYDEWSCSLKTSMCSRKKFGFLDGTIPRPEENSSDYDDYIPVNDPLVSWIKMTIDSSLRSNISHRDSANDL